MEYAAGGWPSQTYSGTKTVTANFFDDADLDEIEGELKRRAFKALQEQFCGLGVTIKGVSIRKGG